MSKLNSDKPKSKIVDKSRMERFMITYFSDDYYRSKEVTFDDEKTALGYFKEKKKDNKKNLRLQKITTTVTYEDMTP